VSLTNPSSAPTDYVRRHLRFGWWSLLVYASFGLILETLHGFKVPLYLDFANDTRRLMWTLAHAHGVLLGLVHVVFALNLLAVPGLGGRRQRQISVSLIGASVLLPGGFLLGGAVFYAGDPGLGVLLVPVGAGLLLAAVFHLARSTKDLDPADARTPRPRKS
jgi:hypothetical protein